MAAIIGSAFIGVILTILAEILLPEKYRIRFQLWKKRLSKWTKNPSYVIGLTERLDFRKQIPMTNAQATMQTTFRELQPTTKGTELHWIQTQGRYDIAGQVQLAYEENRTTGELEAYGSNITVSTKAKYRDLRDEIDDLRASLQVAERKVIEDLEAVPKSTSLYVEIESLEEFTEILENLRATEITGTIRDSDAKFTYYGKRLVIEDGINSRTIAWFKSTIAYVG